MSDQDVSYGGEPTAGEAGSTAHTTVSSIVAILWAPAGVVVWFFMTYCASQFVQASVAAAVYVSIQVGGNVAIGRLLDRHIGGRSGLLASFKRSASCAIGLLVISLPVLYLHPGYTPNCS